MAIIGYEASRIVPIEGHRYLIYPMWWDHDVMAVFRDGFFISDEMDFPERVVAVLEDHGATTNVCDAG